TRPRGAASLTDTTMMSPTPAVRRLEPPSTLMHWTRFAPLLSATSRLDCIWIMVRPLPSQICSSVRVSDFVGLGLLGRLLRGLRLCLFLSRLGRCWIGLRRGHDLRIGDLDRSGLGDAKTVDDLPRLQLGDRRAFFDADDLTGVKLVGCVMRMVLLR